MGIQELKRVPVTEMVENRERKVWSRGDKLIERRDFPFD